MSKKLDKFIKKYNLKYNSKPIYLWAVMLISYYENEFEKIVDIYERILNLKQKKLNVLEKLISNNSIFFEEYIIDFFYKLKFKKFTFDIYNFVLESLTLINKAKGDIDFVYLVFLGKLNPCKSQVECLQELLVFNNMVVNFLKS